MPRDLSRLPNYFATVQVGKPLQDADLALLSREEREALRNLWNLCKPFLTGERVLTEVSYAEIERAFLVVKDLGMMEYCPVLRLAAQFDLDDDAHAAVWAGAREAPHSWTGY